MSSAAATIIACPPERRAEALRLLHDGLPLDQRSALAPAIEMATSDPLAPWDGLLILPAAAPLSAGPIAGVVWVQSLPGNTAAVWPPAASHPAIGSLLHAAASYVDDRRIPLTQFLTAEQDGYPTECVESAGFTKFAELLYLFADVIPACEPLSGLEFAPRAGDEPGRLAALLERTYVDTRDCPALDGVRQMADVFDGYRSQGVYRPEHWYFVRQAGRDVAALLVAHHPAAANCELVYMGVVPEARGHGLGTHLARYARGVAAKLSAERLVLAVDAGNAPALAAYERAGFSTWDRRTVYARLRART